MQIAIILAFTFVIDVVVLVVWLVARRQRAAEAAAGQAVVIERPDGSAERFIVPADVADWLADVARSAATA